MTEPEIRLECLRLACAVENSCEAPARARQFADFVLGTRDAEVLQAARVLAEKVRS